MRISPDSLLSFWFADAMTSPEAAAARSATWFGSDAAFDAEIRDRFGLLPDRAASGELDAWQREARSMLALVIALDQLPRNLYRESPRCFEYDALALQRAREAIDAGFDMKLAPIEASFLYMPFEHAEDLESQERSVALFTVLGERAPAELAGNLARSLEFAKRHRDVIARFGRFPHRNAALGREPTAEESVYLDQGGEDFSPSRGPEE